MSERRFFLPLNRHEGTAIRSAASDTLSDMVTNRQVEKEQQEIGKRRTSRLRIYLPAYLETIDGKQLAAIHDLSQTGARLQIRRAPRLGAAGVLTFARVEAFSTVVWTNKDFIGLDFETALSPVEVLSARREGELLPIIQRQELSEAGRLWCLGR